jgi:hypothetical protein
MVASPIAEHYNEYQYQTKANLYVVEYQHNVPSVFEKFGTFDIVNVNSTGTALALKKLFLS